MRLVIFSTNLFDIPAHPAGGSESGLEFQPIGGSKAIISWSNFLVPLATTHTSELVTYTDTGFTSIEQHNNIGDFVYAGSGEIGFLYLQYYGVAAVLNRYSATDFSSLGTVSIPPYVETTKFPGGFVTYATPVVEPIDSTHHKDTVEATIYMADQTVIEQDIEAITATPLNPLLKGTGPRFPSNGGRIIVNPEGDKLYMPANGSVMTIDIATGNRTMTTVTGFNLTDSVVSFETTLEGRQLPTVTDLTNHLTGFAKLPAQKTVESDLNTDFKIDSSDVDVRANQAP
ncbi:MAG: hypothetical protein ABI579_09590 [Candidatus Sumerlaeota bacterium]